MAQPLPASLRTMAEKVEADERFRETFLADPEGVLREAASGHLPNTSLYRWVVGSLGAALLLCLLASIALPLWGPQPADGGIPEVPDIFVTASSTIIGALAGLLLPQS